MSSESVVDEREGLVIPARTDAGWPPYGPMQAARLHQVMALRGRGLPLKRIRSLLIDGHPSLADVLVMQRDSLAASRARLDADIARPNSRICSVVTHARPFANEQPALDTHSDLVTELVIWNWSKKRD